MATHSSILAWRIPWTEEHGGLESMGSQGQIRSKRLRKQKKSRMDYQKTKGSHPGKIILFLGQLLDLSQFSDPGTTD